MYVRSVGTFLLLLVLLDIQHTSRQRDCLGLCWACVRAPFHSERKFTEHFSVCDVEWCACADRIRKGIAAMFPEQYQFFFFPSILYGRNRTETLGTATEHTGHTFSMQGVFQWFTHHSVHKCWFHSIPLIVNERNPQHIFIVRTNCFHSRIVFSSASLFYEKKTIIFFI